MHVKEIHFIISFFGRERERERERERKREEKRKEKTVDII